jgi:hypothetical protein
MDRVKSNAMNGDITNSRTRISERLNEVATARNYGVQQKINLEKIYRNSDRAIIAEAVTNPANIPVMKNVSIDLITATIPNLVAPELYAVQPIDSPDALVGYWSFEYGDDKGDVKRGQSFNSTMGLGKVAPWYASGVDKDKVIETAASEEVHLGFQSIIPGSVTIVGLDGNTYKDVNKGDGTGTITIGDNELTVYYKSGVLKTPNVYFKGTVTYKYDNINEPTKIPTIFAGRKNIRMMAKQYALSTPISITAAEIARRSLSTDLRAELMNQGFGELSFEIDTLLLNDLIDAANVYPTLTWSAAAPLGVSRKERFADFELMLYQGASVMQNATGRYAPTHILTDSFGLWVLKGIPGFKEKAAANKTGSYVAGEVAGMKVIVATRSHLQPGQIILIHRGAEKLDAPGVYAPYIPITSTEWVPSQELGDKKTYYTWFANQITNPSLMLNIQITDFNIA